MAHPYDDIEVSALRSRPSVKWNWFEEDVIPCWVADMDFPPAPGIGAAIEAYLSHGDLGYPPMEGLPGLREAVCERLEGRFGLAIEPDTVTVLGGIIPGLQQAALALAGRGEGVIVQPPIYPPFVKVVRDSGRKLVANPMIETADGWRFDLEGLEQAIEPDTRLLMLCSPHNPTGRVFTREELEGLAEIVLRHRLWVVSDELHADLTLDGEHIPFAALSPEIAARTVTLYGPTKAFNIAGLKVGFSFSHNPALTEAMKRAGLNLVSGPNVLAQQAALAAYREAGSWLDSTVEYLRGNRERLAEFVRDELTGVCYRPGEGTYLAWLDFRSLELPSDAAGFLLESARVGLNPGRSFGAADEDTWDGFARLNFATSRGVLDEVLERIRSAVSRG